MTSLANDFVCFPFLHVTAYKSVIWRKWCQLHGKEESVVKSFLSPAFVILSTLLICNSLQNRMTVRETALLHYIQVHNSHNLLKVDPIMGWYNMSLIPQGDVGYIDQAWLKTKFIEILFTMRFLLIIFSNVRFDLLLPFFTLSLLVF